MWKNLQINKQNIKTETAKAVLINCPKKSKYSGYSFWHPSKLVRSGKHSYAVSVGYTDEFEFRLKKYGGGKYNSRQILDEVTISAAEFVEMFGVMDENIKAPKERDEVHVPESVEAEEVDVLPELRDE